MEGSLPYEARPYMARASAAAQVQSTESCTNGIFAGNLFVRRGLAFLVVFSA